jgi:hypothetical protein
MSGVGFKPTKRAKTVHALDITATVTVKILQYLINYYALKRYGGVEV